MIICPLRRHVALSNPKGVLAAKAREQPHDSFPGCTVRGARLRFSMLLGGTRKSRTIEEPIRVMETQKLPPASPHSDLAPRTSIVMFHAHNSDHNERFCLWKPQFSPWHNSILTNITIIMLNYCLYYWNIYGSPCNVIQTTPRGHYYHYGNKHLHWRASQRHTKDKLLLEWSITNCCVM